MRDADIDPIEAGSGQAASIRLRSIPHPEGLIERFGEQSSVPTSQRSEAEHPIPMIATLSLMRCHYSLLFASRPAQLAGAPSRNTGNSPGLVALLDSKAHLKLGATPKVVG